jgi:hypothetical protein
MATGGPLFTSETHALSNGSVGHVICVTPDTVPKGSPWGPTARVAEPLTLPDEAVIEVIPAETPTASPPFTVADDDEELQLAVLVKFCVLPSV